MTTSQENQAGPRGTNQSINPSESQPASQREHPDRGAESDNSRDEEVLKERRARRSERSNENDDNRNDMDIEEGDEEMITEFDNDKTNQDDGSQSIPGKD